MDKWVVSTTLRDPDWQNTSVIASDPVEEIRRRKAEPGRDIVQYGFGPIAHALMAAGLIDELRLWIHPFFVGQGGQIFRDASSTMFDLADVTALASGIVVATYRRPA
jgi:dihydrofolate reductase